MEINDVKRLKKLLENLGFLSFIDEPTMKQLARVFRKEYFKKGEFIIKKDEIGDTFFLISKGTAEVFTGEIDEEIRSVYVAGEGEFFGEIALITDGPRTAWVVAQNDVEAYLIKKDNLDKYLMSIPEIAEKIASTAKDRLLH